MSRAKGNLAEDTACGFLYDNGFNPLSFLCGWVCFCHFKRLQGLSVVFNGNIYAIPYATIALATTNMEDLMCCIEFWEKGGRDLVIKKILALEKKGNSQQPYFPEMIL